MIKLTPALHNRIKHEYDELSREIRSVGFKPTVPFEEFLCNKLDELNKTKARINKLSCEIDKIESDARQEMLKLHKEIAQIQKACPHIITEHHACYESKYDECLVCGSHLNEKF